LAARGVEIGGPAAVATPVPVDGNGGALRPDAHLHGRACTSPSKALQPLNGCSKQRTEDGPSRRVHHAHHTRRSAKSVHNPITASKRVASTRSKQQPQRPVHQQLRRRGQRRRRLLQGAHAPPRGPAQHLPPGVQRPVAVPQRCRWYIVAAEHPPPWGSECRRLCGYHGWQSVHVAPVMMSANRKPLCRNKDRHTEVVVNVWTTCSRGRRPRRTLPVLRRAGARRTLPVRVPVGVTGVPGTADAGRSLLEPRRR
jgi:hypothetical protein